MKTKRCTQCGKEKLPTDFYKHSQSLDGRSWRCKACGKEYDREYRRKNRDAYNARQRKRKVSWSNEKKEAIKAYQKEYRQRNKNTLRIKKREYAKRTRLEGISEYGGKCGCCGELHPEFLTIHHINGRLEEDQERGYRITGQRMWANLKKRGWPKEDYELLCFNCNCAIAIYGECPHRKEAQSGSAT